MPLPAEIADSLKTMSDSNLRLLEIARALQRLAGDTSDLSLRTGLNAQFEQILAVADRNDAAIRSATGLQPTNLSGAASTGASVAAGSLSARPVAGTVAGG